ncbi:Proteasome-associated ECM29-like protein [Nymphaea thermarum]|nr:Proteasome-associated ECM29-like protein [Nymphaea thermarum]
MEKKRFDDYTERTRAHDGSTVEDVVFAAGEDLSFIWGGVPITADKILKSEYISLSFSSNYLTGDVPSFSYTVDMNSMGIDDEDTRILVRDNICKKLFDGLLYSSRKEERCAGTIWLLSLTVYCGHHPKIQELLPEIQEAFSYLLGDSNELTQDLASQGMCIVYEIGNSAMKRDLVNALVGTLAGTSKRKKAIKLTEDSEVFQEGTISQSPSGGKLSTYKL